MLQIRRLGLCIPPRLLADVEAAARASELSISEFVRMALRDRVAAERRQLSEQYAAGHTRQLGDH
jgi:metal-responsive CopG/Arc/MetJ family transcriptional regulator